MPPILPADWTLHLPVDALTATALTTAALLVASLCWQHWRRRSRARQRPAGLGDKLDTVQAWMPERSRVLSVGELQALELARCAAPHALVLAQVPLARFLRVPTRHSYSRWLSRVGQLQADLVLCDAHAQAVAVVDVRRHEPSERSRRRHDRMVKVLNAAGIAVLVWHEDRLPSINMARAQFGALGLPQAGPGATGKLRTESQTLTSPRLQPRELMDLLAVGDAQARQHRQRRAGHDALAGETLEPVTLVH